MLTDLVVFSDFMYTAATAVLAQQINLFNEATMGSLELAATPHGGDYFDKVSFAKVSGGLTRRRNVYMNPMGAAPTAKMSHLDETMVKVAAGTPTVELTPSQWSWINRDPQEAAAAMALQLSVDTMADMVNTTVGVLAVALQTQANATHDISAVTGNTGPTTYPYPANRISPLTLNDTAALFGDMAARINCWLMHSGALFQLFGSALQNQTRLFNYGTVNVVQDGFGRRYVMSDVPALTTGTGNSKKFISLGLTPSAARCWPQDDFDANFDKRNGLENISLTYQAEWSYLLGVRGFQWDKTNGGHSPTDAALMTGSNWDRIVQQDKDLPGVVHVTGAVGL